MQYDDSVDESIFGIYIVLFEIRFLSSLVLKILCAQHIELYMENRKNEYMLFRSQHILSVIL